MKEKKEKKNKKAEWVGMPELWHYGSVAVEFEKALKQVPSSHAKA